ncbi:tRNA uridine 5-carboxymethylaminomethyl modification enzyme MnmG [Bienertia sinuspersici]
MIGILRLVKPAQLFALQDNFRWHCFYRKSIEEEWSQMLIMRCYVIG